MTALSEWQNFYVIVGSSAGALIGLQFVVVTLIAQLPGIRREAGVSATWATPTTVHLVSALILAAVMAVPWHELSPVAFMPGVAGAAGTVYAAMTGWRMGRQAGYKPEFEDWIFHALLPLAAYAGLVVSAMFLHMGQIGGLHGVAAATLVLLLIGIHNAWDTVTYHVFVKKKETE